MDTSERPIRTRIAPSPTGNCHVGTARNALYNLLFAHQQGGSFVLRIDDTDQARSTERSERGILEALSWLGLNWDEGPDIGGTYGPYRQSERLDLYNSYARALLENGRAYRCFCTPDELAAERKAALSRGGPPRYSGRCRHLTDSDVRARLRSGLDHVIRLRIEPTLMTITDLVQGPISQNAGLLGDPVIVKSDGMPTYHFATVVDEHTMRITHVIRGAEHLNNTFPQLQIAEALGFDPPAYAHVGLLLNPDRSKISKRTGAVYVGEFEELGYLPEAIVNHLALSGWSPGDDREIFSFSELLEAFSLARCSASNAVFDRDKLLWMNGVYIRQLPTAELARRVRPFLAGAGYIDPAPADSAAERHLKNVVALEQERLKTLAEAPELLGFFFQYPDPSACTALLKTNRYTRRRSLGELLTGLAASMCALERVTEDRWEAGALSAVLDAQVKELKWKRGELFMAIRIAVSGRAATPSLFETLEAVGRPATLRRLEACVARGKQEAAPMQDLAAASPYAIVPDVDPNHT